MPDGFYGPTDEWQRMETPLLHIDPILDNFAQENALRVRRNYHNWPERSLLWDSAGIRKLIQVYVDDEKQLTFTFWICASEDRGPKRFWKQKKLREGIDADDLSSGLDALLTEGKENLDSWTDVDLEPATK